MVHDSSSINIPHFVLGDSLDGDVSLLDLENSGNTAILCKPDEDWFMESFVEQAKMIGGPVRQIDFAVGYDQLFKEIESTFSLVDNASMEMYVKDLSDWREAEDTLPTIVIFHIRNSGKQGGTLPAGWLSLAEAVASRAEDARKAGYYFVLRVDIANRIDTKGYQTKIAVGHSPQRELRKFCEISEMYIAPTLEANKGFIIAKERVGPKIFYREGYIPDVL